MLVRYGVICSVSWSIFGTISSPTFAPQARASATTSLMICSTSWRVSGAAINSAVLASRTTLRPLYGMFHTNFCQRTTLRPLYGMFHTNSRALQIAGNCAHPVTDTARGELGERDRAVIEMLDVSRANLVRA